MNILFIHQNFPGQFRHIIQHLQKMPDVHLLGIGLESAPGLEGIKLIRYKPHRAPAPQTHHYTRTFESAVLYGQQVLRILIDLKQNGYTPDVVIAHPGWGESLFVKEVFPNTKLIHFCEFYYHTHGADIDFDPEFPATLDDRARISCRNGLHLLNLEQCDIAISPTHWQKSLHPQTYHNKINVIHEGINTNLLKPNSQASITLPSGKTLSAGQPIITYVARNLEPYRGFHTFMRTLPLILKRNPNAEVIIVGGDDVSYGAKPKDAKNWQTKLLKENPMPLDRIHFLGKVPYAFYQQILQVSAVHIYLTYPFVLSWSCLEAMACGCLMVASNTTPVQEVITHNKNGILVDFFDSNALAKQISTILAVPQQFQALRKAAIQTALSYSVNKGNTLYEKLIFTKP